jgi:hypothetical protein
MECDRDQCDFKMVVILAAIFKMATKMRKISNVLQFQQKLICRVFPTVVVTKAIKMATIMAAMATIFKSHLSLSHSSGRKSSKYKFSLKL